jgi:hypothetical protein
MASKGLVAPAVPIASSSRTTSPPGDCLLSTGARRSQDGGHSQARVRCTVAKVEVVRKKPKEPGWTANTRVAENTPR